MLRKLSKYDLPNAKLICKDCEILVQIANTPRSREKGLSGVDFLSENEGMLFDFEIPQYISLWMPNMSFDLSVAFIDTFGTIVDLQDMFKDQPNIVHTSSVPAQYALEVNLGFFEKNNIRVGDTVFLLSK